MSVLSVQSAVAYGHVGNSAAVFVLQRLGHDTWPVNTVVLSNHTAYPSCRGGATAPAALRELLLGIEECGGLAGCEAVLSGYLGTPAQGEAVLATVARARHLNGGVLYCCDPVMGDKGKGFFVKPGVPEFYRDHALAAADIMIPNVFELEFLADRPCEDIGAALTAADAVRARGPRVVVVTGIEPGPGEIGALAVSADGAWLSCCPRIEAPENGVGDAFTALFLGHLLGRQDVAEALRRAVSAVHGIMAATAAAKAGEIQVVAAQEAIRAPATLFKAERLR